MADLFDAAGMYDEDYPHFFASDGELEHPGREPATPSRRYRANPLWF